MATKILIVEDNSDLADLLSLYLRFEGFETLQAGNSAQGINKALVERPDLVITDLHLPDMTAVDAAIILKQDPMTSTIPIIVLTATTVREWRNKALDAGVAEYLIKPISPLDLTKAVRKFIQAPSLLIEH
jgi:DNA-binding response OmpR family regulator